MKTQVLDDRYLCENGTKVRKSGGYSRRPDVGETIRCHVDADKGTVHSSPLALTAIALADWYKIAVSSVFFIPSGCLVYLSVFTSTARPAKHLRHPTISCCRD